MTTPSAPSAADELRLAAALLRELTRGETRDTPWTAMREPRRDGKGMVTLLVTSREESVFEDAHCSFATAAYIATMHPTVGVSVAALLDEEAQRVKAAAEDGRFSEARGSILRIARLINEVAS